MNRGPAEQHTSSLLQASALVRILQGFTEGLFFSPEQAAVVWPGAMMFRLLLDIQREGGDALTGQQTG